MAMKLYDVIKKDHEKKGITDLEQEPVYTVPPQVPDQEPRVHIRRRSPLRKWIVLGSGLAFLVFLYIIGVVFVHATVTISQRRIPFSLQKADIVLANEKNTAPGTLSFQTMVVSDSVSRQVFGSALSTSTTKATGKAVIVNQYSKSAQTVKSGTTLTGANGKKYITQSKVTVPGYSGSGTTKTAGSATVSIVAADVGPSYNSDGTTFTISGYGGTAAKTFYATSAGAIGGGQNGAVHTLSDKDRQQTITTLRDALTEKLARETRSQIPDDLITFPSLQFTSIDTSSMVLQGSTIQFPATIKGTMVSYLIPRDLLEQAIASKAISDHTYPTVDIPELGSIDIEPASAIPSDPSVVPESITISVSGQGTVITKASTDEVTQAVIGIKSRAFETAISGIPEIDTAHYSLMPFWAPYFPYKASRITVKTN